MRYRLGQITKVTQLTNNGWKDSIGAGFSKTPLWSTYALVRRLRRNYYSYTKIPWSRNWAHPKRRVLSKPVKIERG